MPDTGLLIYLGPAAIAILAGLAFRLARRRMRQGPQHKNAAKGAQNGGGEP